MRVVRLFISFISVIFLALSAVANDTASADSEGARMTGFVKVAEDRELYVDYIQPAPGRPVVVLVNGLTYSTTSWNAFAYALEGDGIGILRYDPMGQGRTLLRYAPANAPFEIEDQVSDLKTLLDELGLDRPVHFVGLSYGGALATIFATRHPEQVASLIIMAPFVAPLDKQDQWIKTQIQYTRIMYPYNRATDDELYDYFLRNIVYSTYPAAEPVVLENPYKLEATFRLVQGIRKYLATDLLEKVPAGKYHLVLARRDQYVPNPIHEEHWALLPTAARASLFYIERSEHKIPEAVPRFSAEWVRRIVNGDSMIRGGAMFVGDPARGTVTAEDGSQITDFPRW